MTALNRLLHFVVFTLIEYARSGRILVEILATMVFFYIFLWRWTARPDYFFSTVGLFTLVLTFSTIAAMQNLGDRPQGYLILMRQIGRGTYLMGLYLAALVVVLAIYLLVSLGAILLQRIVGMDAQIWLLGSLPLLLNVALLGSLLMLLAPMVLTASWRLAVLALFAIAFSGNLLSGPVMARLGPIARALEVLRTIFSTPLLPPFTAFELSRTQNYSGINAIIPIAQLSLTLGLLALAVFSFSRRELIFSTS
ncbi:MAG TPA: hypothetical protein VFX76_19745 [Roseiflexaceae bacterium]|nr:hypothetical protein [Roseiflexaceae bacterium]